MHADITTYNTARGADTRELCELLACEIDAQLPDAESRVWHGHPVWFLDGNPVAGYSDGKAGVTLLFWSGQSFDEAGLTNDGKFKAAHSRYASSDEINLPDLHRWLVKSRDIQWDYKNIVKRKGQLERLK